MRHTPQLLAAAALLTATAAHAGSVLGTTLLGGPQVIDGSVTVGLTGSGTLDTKTVNGLTAVGVRGGPSGNEIDIGQWLLLSFSEGVLVTDIGLSFLYDGPEYGDFHEKAQLTATLAGGGSLVATLTAVGVSTAVASAGSASIVGGQLANGTGAAHWSWVDPFGDALVTSIKLEALSSNPGGNESDYSLYSIGANAVPEPGSLALMLAGVAALGWVARRRV